MPIARNKEFYDLIAQGLTAYGYTSFSEYLNDMFAEKYNADKTYEQLGFPLNPSIPINPTYEQLEATVRPYTMATHTDIDSDGPTKSPDGLSISMGQIPVFKHEYTIGRKTLREQMYLADRIGSVTADIIDVVMEQLFITTDSLLGGNYNTMAYMRHQVVSNDGKLVINASNSNLGIPLSIDFGVNSANKVTSAWYTKAANGKVTAKTNIDPIKDLKDLKSGAERKSFMPRGHFEVSKTTWDDVMSLGYFQEKFATASYPGISSDNVSNLASLAPEEAVKTWLEKVIGARIVVIDHIGFVEKFDTATKKLGFVECESFKEGVFVYVPDGAIGDTQFGRPIAMETPGARNAFYDGGRTLIRQVFNDEKMYQTIKSEFTGIVVPNKTRWMYYLTVKG